MRWLRRREDVSVGELEESAPRFEEGYGRHIHAACDYPRTAFALGNCERPLDYGLVPRWGSFGMEKIHWY